MSQKEIERLGVIKRLEMKAISQKEAASLMRLTTRQVRNLYKKYKLNGPSGLSSKPRGRQSNNRLCPSKCSKALEIIKSTYYDFGPTLTHEKLIEEHGFKLSVESVRQLMIKEGSGLVALHFVKSESIEGYVKAFKKHLKSFRKPLA